MRQLPWLINTNFNFNISGIKANSLDIAPNYAGVVMAVANGLGGLTGVVGPYIVGLLTPNVSLIFCLILAFGIIKINLFLICIYHFLIHSHCSPNGVLCSGLPLLYSS